MGLVISCRSGVPIELDGFKDGDKIEIVYLRRGGRNSVKILFLANKHIKVTRGDKGNGKDTRQKRG